MNTTEQFYADCGQIILLSTSIEHELGKHLTTFLLYNRPNIENETDQFSRMEFEDKINLVKKLCETRKTNSEAKNQLISALHIIQQARNKVAHWGASYDPEKEKFELKHREKLNKEPLDVNKLVQEVNANWFIAHKVLWNLHNEIFNFANTETTSTEEKK